MNFIRSTYSSFGQAFAFTAVLALVLSFAYGAATIAKAQDNRDADLSIEKNADNYTPSVGDTVTYTIKEPTMVVMLLQLLA